MMSDSRIILGIQFGGHDTSAALMIGDQIVAACEQERYTRDKHSRKFPKEAMQDCLDLGGVSIDQVDEIAYTNDPIYYIRETYLKSALETPERIGFLIKDIDRIREFYEIDETIRAQTEFDGPIRHYLHHLCHVASSYYPSGFEDALLLSFDGMGEIDTGLMATGRQGNIEVVHDGMRFPHSLGLLYSAVTDYLGFLHHCDEGIVMGLAPYGDPDALTVGGQRTYAEVFDEIVEETGDYTYAINLDWTAYQRVRDVWVSDLFLETLGPRRKADEKIDARHMNIAAALQQRLEKLVLKQLAAARKEFGIDKLCLAGGVALNCSMNGKIEASNIFDEVFIQPASGDNGLPIGACYLANASHGEALKPRRNENYYLGGDCREEDILAASSELDLPVRKVDDIYAFTADKLREGKIIGWFQGRAEFGPRALGNRSILTRPFPADMKDYLNSRVKFREYFRPFAPAVLAERLDDYFEIGQRSPHMLIACQVREDKRDEIPAVVHVDGSCRVQTVTAEGNERFYKLLQSFEDLTDCPVLLNTSFNVKGQPIVNTPREALECFNSTNIDVLVVGDYVAEKN